MNTEKLAQSLIGVASKLRNALSEISLGYDLIYGVIEKEHSAIVSHDLPEIQKLLEQKNEVGFIIEQQTNAMQTIALSLKETFEEYTDESWTDTLGMKQCLSMLEKLSELMKEDSLEKSLVRNTIAKLQKTIAQFQQRLQSIKPKIETNSILLKNLLRNHQESYLFFLNLCEKEAANYNAQGKKPESKGSTISVKA